MPQSLVQILLEPGHWDRSRTAAMALGESGDLQVVPALCQALKPHEFLSATDGYWAVREAAAYALARLGDKRAVQPLCEMMEHDSATVARYAAAKVLGQFRDVRAIEPLCRALADSGTRDYPVGYAASESLAMMRDARSIDPLFQAAIDEGWRLPGYVAKLAARVLGEIRDVRSVKPLLELLRTHPSEDVRTAAAVSLGNLGFAEALPVLKERSKFFGGDRRGKVRAAIRQAMSKIKR